MSKAQKSTWDGQHETVKFLEEWDAHGNQLASTLNGLNNSLQHTGRGVTAVGETFARNLYSVTTWTAAVGALYALLGAAKLDALNKAWHRLDPWPEAVAGLTRLKRRFIIAPLSNGNIALMTNMAKRAGIPWDAILGAEVVQAYKPQPEAYLRTAEVLGIAPAELCLVAAHNNDLAAARQCGLQTAFVTRAAEHGAAQTTDLVASEAWDVVAEDFQDLAHRLGV
jgi:2-haloalkanoic acid dehalogenase type II